MGETYIYNDWLRSLSELSVGEGVRPPEIWATTAGDVEDLEKRTGGTAPYNSPTKIILLLAL